MKVIINNIVFIFILATFSGCYILKPKRWMYVTRNKDTVTRNDSIISCKYKKHLFLKGYMQEDSGNVFSIGDTTYKHRQKWCALGRISPNARQLITTTTKKYNKSGKLVYNERQKKSLLMFDSWVRTRIIYFDTNGKRVVVKRKE